MACCMLVKVGEAKISGAWRLVIRSVLLGGDGWVSGGRSERSMLMLCEWRLDPGGVECADEGGEEISIAAMF